MKFLKALGIFLILCILSFYIFLRTERVLRFKSNIPEKLELGRVVLQGEDSTPWFFGFVIPIESCGGGVFKLSKSTLKSIESEGLSFFEDATKPRGRKYQYPTWQETPVPDTWTSNGAWPALACIDSNDTSKLIRKITKTSELSGSYYVGSPNSTLLVLPELGFVVFGYWD